MRIFDYYGSIDPVAAVPLDKEVLQRRVVNTRLNRVLAFTGLSIDDVVNSPIAKNQVRGYWKLSKTVDRRSEIVELERQWNPNGYPSAAPAFRPFRAGITMPRQCPSGSKSPSSSSTS